MTQFSGHARVTDNPIGVFERQHEYPVQKDRGFWYLYDVPGGASRAGHALKTCHKFVIAASGSFDVILDDGERKQSYHLNRSYYGLYIPPLIWREIDNFSTGSVSLVLASEKYDESDYYRDYGEYLRACKQDRVDKA